jgi:iron(III)-salmochelin esterase
VTGLGRRAAQSITAATDAQAGRTRFEVDLAAFIRCAAPGLRLFVLAIAVLQSSACERAPLLPSRDAPESDTSMPVRAEATLVNVPEPAPSDPATVLVAQRRELTWTFDEGAFGPTDVVISIPEGAAPNARFPVLVALHGRGESLKGSQRGARGWFDDYELGQAMQRLRKPPLKPSDFQDYVSRERLRRINRSLAQHPYQGLIVVCPFLPDVLRGDDAFSAAEPLAAFIVDVLLPRVYERTPAIGSPATTGIDGVSLGGRAALLVGWTRPLAFGAVGALQAAIDGAEVDRFVELGSHAIEQNPKLALRLLTSAQDHFLRVNERLSAELSSHGVRHQFLRVVGTHSYRFNRGPGAFEMLLFHDRVLRGVAWK